MKHMLAKTLMPSTIFRQYDIRGKVGSQIDIDQMYNVGRALAYFFNKKSSVKKIAIGMDGRIHSPFIKDALVNAMLDSGLDVVFIGLCHSPALYFAMHTEQFDAGIMVTASHNPKEYNGIKVCIGTSNMWRVEIQELYELYAADAKIEAHAKGVYSEQDIIASYIAWLVKHFTHLQGMSLPVVIDCANGAAGSVIPLLVKQMGWKDTKVLYPDIDGTYPHHEADPTVLENMHDVQQTLEKDRDLLIGVGFDGDADRMAAMTKKGRLVPGDLLLGLFAQQVVHEFPGATIVFDIKSSLALIRYLNLLGAKPVISPSGHSIIKEEMKKHGALLGGELSCHFFFHDRYFGYDDGVYAMLRLFELIAQGNNLDQLLEVYQVMCTSPEFRIACDEQKKSLIVQTVSDIFAQHDQAELITIDGVRVTMPYGWGLLRASNTQPALSIRFESDTPEDLAHIKQDFIKVLAPFYEETFLHETFSQG